MATETKPGLRELMDAKAVQKAREVLLGRREAGVDRDPDERERLARAAMTGLSAGGPVTPSMYR